MTEVNENQSGWIWGDIITIPSINRVMCTAGASVLSHSHRHHFHAYCDTNHLQIIYRTLFILTIFWTPSVTRNVIINDWKKSANILWQAVSFAQSSAYLDCPMLWTRGISQPTMKYRKYPAWAKLVCYVAAAMQPFTVNTVATCVQLLQLYLFAILRRCQAIRQKPLPAKTYGQQKLT